MSDLLNRDNRLNRDGRRASVRSPRAGNGPTPDQARTLASVAFKTSGLVVVVAATLVVLSLVSANSDLTGTLGAIAGSWFSVHLVPLSIGGTSLGVAPLLPTLIVGWSVARSVHRAVDAHTDRSMVLWVFGASLAGPLAVTAIALAVAKDASTVIGLSSPNALVAFSWVIGVHALASGTGLAFARWNSVVLRRGLPDWVRALVAPFVRSVSVLVAGGAAIVAVALLSSWETAGTLVEGGRNFVGMLGLTALSVLYLPNVLVGALAVSTGSTASFGDAAVSLFSTTGGPLPPLPILAVLPEGPAQTIWIVMLAVPVGAGFLLGRDCAIRSADIRVALSSVWVVAAAVGVLAALFGYAAGGNLGTFGTVEVTVWSFGLSTFAWLAVAGSASAAIVVWRRPAPDPVSVADERASEPIVAAVTAGAAEHEENRAVVEAEIVDALPVTSDESGSDESGSGEPGSGESGSGEPGSEQGEDGPGPVATEMVDADPVVDNPVVDHPVVDHPVVDNPVVADPADAEPLDVEIVAPPEDGPAR